MSLFLTRRRRGTSYKPRFTLPAATVNDTFAAESDGVLLSAHTSDTAGTGGSPSWTVRSGAATTAAILTADHAAKCSSATLSTTYVHNHTPTGAEYTVYCKVKFIALTAGENASFSARGSVASTDRYYVTIAADTGAVSLVRSVSSVDTTLMTWTPASGPSLNNVWELRFECANNEKSVLVKRGSDTEYIRRCYSNDNSIVGAGKAGIGLTKQAMRISGFAVYQAVRPNIRPPLNPNPDVFVPLFAVSGGQGRNAQPAYMYDKLGTTTKIDDTIDQTLFQAELLSKSVDRWINYSGFTTKRIIVADNAPLEPVLLYRSNWGGGFTGTNYPAWAHQADQICRAGYPVPDDYVPDAGSDKELCLIQPTYQPTAWTTLSPVLVGRYFEGWIFEPNPAYNAANPKVWPNYKWRCAWPARIGGMNVFPGHFADWTTDAPQSFWPFQGYHATDPTDANGTFCSAGFGASASGLFLADSEILKTDLDRHAAGAWGLGHTIGLSIPQVGGFRWPAQRSDATATATHPMKYGMRVVLPANFVIPGGLHPVCQALVENCILSDDPNKPCYGLILHEQTNQTVAFKAQPGAQIHWSGVAPNVVLNGFPWDSLQVIATGQDGLTTPIFSSPPAAPVNTVAPIIAGPTVQAQTLGLGRGTWTGSILSYAYKWQRSADGSTGWADIASATNTTYLLAAADVGKFVRGVVSVTNLGGTTTVNTASSAVISAGTAPFMRDTFTGTDGVTVQSRVGEVGATWTKHPSTNGGEGRLLYNRVLGPPLGGTNIFYSSATPPNANYDVTVCLFETTDNNSSAICALGRMSTTLNTYYMAEYSSITNTCRLLAVSAGVGTVLATGVVAHPAATITLKMSGNQISMLADGVQIVAPVTDNSLAGAGRAGFRQTGTSGGGVGLQVDNIEAVAT